MSEPSLRYNVDRVAVSEGGLVVEGWAAGGDARPLLVDAAVGPREAGAALADDHRPDLEAAGVGAGRHGFRLRLPDTSPEAAGGLRLTTSGTPLALTAATAIDETLLTAWPPLLRTQGGMRSGVHHRHGLLRVWVESPDDPAELAVELDGSLVWSGPLRRRDAVWLDGALRVAGGAVRLRLPEPAAPCELRTLRLLHGAVELPGSPLRLNYADQYRGNLDRIDRIGPDRLVARGWCVNQAAPSQPTRFVVTRDGQPLAEGLAYGARDDLRAAGIDAPDAAFQIEFPATADDPGPFAVRPALSLRDLSGDGRVRQEADAPPLAPPPPRPAAASRRVRVVAFAVTEASPATAAGDYFTALELGRALAAARDVEVRYLQVLAGEQYEVGDADVVIAMRDDYDPTRIGAARPNLLKVAWVRNWFDRFSAQPFLHGFDQVWAASARAAGALSERLGRAVEVLPIASDADRFGAGRPRPEWRSDYAFTGAYWNVNRELAQNLDPAGLPFAFALFGQGWSGMPALAPYARGHVAYADLRDVYASTRVVIDDANHVTKPWAAVNSRVFDALAAGALVLTNGEGGSAELFDDLLPTYDTPQSLEALLWTYLTDEPSRLDLVRRLQAIVLERHTYAHRAASVWRWLDAARAA